MRNPVQVSIANKKKYKRLNKGAAECINEEHDISDLESSSAGLPGACRPNLEGSLFTYFISNQNQSVL